MSNSEEDFKDLDIPMEELDKMIEEGVAAHNELTQLISRNISDLANTAHTVGRYQELKRQKELAQGPEDVVSH